jgi:hypothetical protein
MIHNGQAWRLQMLFGPGDTSTRRYHPVNGAVVLNELAHRLTPRTDEPVYKFIHVGVPHQPVALNGNCEFTGVVRATRSSYKGQARCAVMRTAAILDRLKSEGVYDNTFVVVSSDHGVGQVSPSFANDRWTPGGRLSSLAGKAMALLVVKPLNSKGPVRISQAPTTITDIPATVLNGVGVAHTMPGEAGLTLSPTGSRIRPWATYDWEHEGWAQNSFETLDILEVNGPLLDGNSWNFIDTIYGPTANAASRTRGLYETQRSRSGLEYRWSAPDIFFHLAPSTRSIEMKIRSIAPEPRTVTVSAGEHMLEKVTLTDQSWVTLKHVLPPPANPSVHWVHVHVDPPWRPRGEARILGVQTRDIIFTP